MSAHPEWRPRLSVLLTADQYRALQERVPWGLKNQIFRNLVDQLLESLQKDPDGTLAAALGGKLKLEVRR